VTAGGSTPGPDDERAPSLDDSEVLAEIYKQRFSPSELEAKQVVWRTLCSSFFQRYVQPTDTVLDLGAGSCEFINHIVAGRKLAVDLNPATVEHARDAEVILVPSTDMAPIADGTVDVVFTSNFFEHLRSKEDLLLTLQECKRVLRPGGTLIVLMPNIRYLAGRYWDYLDHHLPLTHLSLVEALELTAFVPTRVVPRFLPYTVKDRQGLASARLIRLYLKVPLAWRVLGRQMLVVATA
jgi:SAM-dependent methyltransferase